MFIHDLEGEILVERDRSGVHLKFVLPGAEFQIRNLETEEANRLAAILLGENDREAEGKLPVGRHAVDEGGVRNGH